MADALDNARTPKRRTARAAPAAPLRFGRVLTLHQRTGVLLTVAAKERAQLRKQLYPKVVEYLNTQSHMRYSARPSRIRSAAKQICMNIVAAKRRFDLAAAA